MFTQQSLLRQLTSTLQGMLNLHADFKGWMKESHVSLTESQFDKLSKYLLLLKSKNEELNLTRITDPREMWIKHVLDSLMAAPFFDLKPGMKVMDLGSGGGIPGIPLAILFPSLQFTLVDSVQKKVDALREFAHNLNLENVCCIAMRIETLAHQSIHREQYDIVTARALAPVRVLAELAIPLIHPYGKVIAYKGPDYVFELADAKSAIHKLQAESPRVYHYALPEDQGQRTLVVMTKKTVTPSIYPRREGIPNKRPL